MNYLQRIHQVTAQLAGQSLLVTRRENVFYLIGASGHSDFDVVLLLATDKTFILGSPLYENELQQVGARLGLEVLLGPLLKTLGTIVSERQLQTILFEADHITVHLRDRMATALSAELASAVGVIEKQRLVKDSDEIECLRQASRATDEQLRLAVAQLKPGMSEKQVAIMLKQSILGAGHELSFEPIVAFGTNSANPHHQPGESRLEVNDIVQFDIGVRIGGYGSDLSRVVFVGEPQPRWAQVYDCVKASLQAARAACQPGVDGRTLDKLAKDLIAANSLPPFTHGLGHGVGLDPHVHESPTLNQLMPTAQPLLPGMVFTLEPAVYLPGEFGIRLEDTVLMTEKGVETLTKAEFKQ